MGDLDARPDPYTLGPDFAPTPFTAGEIRTGCPNGRTVRMRFLGSDPPPGAAAYSVTRFVEGDAEGVTMEHFVETARHEIVGAVNRIRMTWLELQQLAAFPADATEIAEETLLLPIGSHDCLRYTVRRPGGDTIFWFAKALPGMAVKAETVDPRGVRHTRVVVADEYTV